MKLHHVFALAFAVILTGSLGAEEARSVKSGPQVGEDLAGPFHPLNVTGEAAGKKHCLYCQNGSNPVVMIFAREVTEDLGKLCKQIEGSCEKNSGCKLSSFVVVCSTEEGVEGQLKKLAKDNSLEKVVLSIDNPAGPKGYKVSRDADITVVLYKDRNVKANHAFKKGEMKAKDIESIVKDLPKITKE